MMAVRAKRGIGLRWIAPVALMPAAAFAVHQLRYWLAFGSQAGYELQRQGHSYLHSVVPWLVLLVAIATGAFLRAVGRAFGGDCAVSRWTVSFAAVWLLCWACLVAIYVIQESLEGLLATGHPGGLVGIFGYGGWWAIPVAAAVGLVLAAVFHVARWVLAEVWERYGQRTTRTLRPIRTPLPLDVVVPRLAPLAGGWSSRGPPGLN